jgi:hypothetical protein
MRSPRSASTTASCSGECRCRARSTPSTGGDAPERLVVAIGGLVEPHLRVLDVTRPREPVEVGTVPLFHAPPRTYAWPTGGVGDPDGRHMYFSDRGFGLWIVDLEARTARNARMLYPSDAIFLVEKGGRTLVGLDTDTGYDVFAFFDVSNPDDEQFFKTITPARPYGVETLAADNDQFFHASKEGLCGYDLATLDELWHVTFGGAVDEPGRESFAAFVGSQGPNGQLFVVWQNPQERVMAGTVTVPTIASITVKKKDLVITGHGFEPEAKVLVDGVERTTVSVGSNRLRVKKLRDGLEPGQVVRVQVRNPSGPVSTPRSYEEAP